MKKLKLFWYVVCGMWYVVWVSPVYAASASLSVSPASGTYPVGQEFTIDVILNTGGAETGATDLYLNFNPNTLQALDVIPGTLYNQYVGKAIDNTSGKAEISGLAISNTNLYQGEGVFAQVKFIGKNQGTAQVTFDFVAGNQNDCNVAEFETTSDILASVSDGSYQITGEGGAGGPPAPTATPRPTFGPTCSPTPRTVAEASPQPTPQLPVTDGRWPTLFVAGLGSLLLTLALFLL